MMRIAVLGAGRIGKIHAANVAANPRAKLVVVADPVEEAARSLAHQHGCEATTDPVAAIESADVDAIVIGTPTDTHISLMLRAVSAGKPVLCEKPIDLDIGKVDAAIAEVERLKARVMIAFNRRFDPSAAALRRAIDAGEIGDVRQVVMTSRDLALPPRDYIRSSGGVFRDMVIHDFDMARWLLREEPVEVFALAGRLVDPGLSDVDDYDALMVLLRTASGRQCHINGCRECVYGYDQRLEVFGSRGMLLNDNLRPTTLRRYRAAETEVRERLLDFFPERYAESYRLELDAFLTSLATNGPMPVTPRDGRQALRLADCALESVRAGRAVAV
jgi:myo-inositol 2-dehydrogenase / D-chiro-inositol 1-dehydrogenase